MAFNFDEWTSRQLASLGVTEDRITRVLPYEYVIDWSAIAAGGSQEASCRIDMGTPFIIAAYAFSPFLAVASGTAIVGTPLLREPDSWNATTTSGPNGNTLQSIDTLRINMRDSAGNWHNSPVRAANFAGRHDCEMSLAQRVIGGGVQLFGTLFNDGAQSISAQLCLKGFRVYAA